MSVVQASPSNQCEIFTHARLYCGCRTRQQGVEESVVVVLEEKARVAPLTIHFRDLPLFDTGSASPLHPRRSADEEEYEER